MPPWYESILGLKVEAVQGKNGLRHLGDAGNGGTTLEFLSPFLWRAPPLEIPLPSMPGPKTLGGVGAGT